MDRDSRFEPPFFQFLRLDGDGVNEQQTLTITGTPTGGTFTVTRPAGGGLAAETSGAIAFDATAADVKAALDAMTNIDTVTCTGGPLPGVNEVQSVALTGGPTGGTFTLTFDGQTTGAIAYNADAAAVDTALEALSNIDAGDVACTGGPLPGVNEVQTLTITGTPTGGTFALTFDGQTTAGIAFDADSATVQTALEALSNIAVDDVACTGGPLPGTPVVITYLANLGAQDVALMTADGALLTGGSSPDAAVALTTPGSNDPIVVTFTEALGAQDVALMTGSAASLTGGSSPAVAVSLTTPGSNDPVIITFTGTSGLQDQPLMTTTDSLTGGSTPASAITLTTRGIATDEHNMAIDGSSTPQVFGIRPTASQLFVVSELLLAIQDTGAMTAALFGFATAIVNGLTLKVLDSASATLYDLFNGEPPKTNADLAKFCTDLTVHSWGAGDEILQARFDLSKSGSPLVVDGAASQTLVATVQDDLTGLNFFTIAARGYRKV